MLPILKKVIFFFAPAVDWECTMKNLMFKQNLGIGLLLIVNHSAQNFNNLYMLADFSVGEWGLFY